MPKIDTSGWGDFSISDICCVLKGRKKLSNVNITDLGSIPVYSSTTENNGIIGYTEESPDYVIDTDTPFYIIFGDHTKSMYISTNDFCVMDNVKVLVPKVYNKYAMQFVLASWQKSIPTLGYSRHWSVAEKAIFKLPTDTQGKPDWQYMENYMRNIEVKVSTSISKLESAQGVENSKIDVSGWGEFIVGELFTIDRGKRQKAQDRIKGDIPYYSASNEANGMTDSIGNPTFTDKDTIIGTTFGDFFYVNGVFSGSDEITIYHHPKVDGNEYIGLFVVSALKQNKHKYSFTSKMFKERAEKDFIYLPIDSQGNPDWLYMENYMKTLTIQKNIDNRVHLV